MSTYIDGGQLHSYGVGKKKEKKRQKEEEKKWDGNDRYCSSNLYTNSIHG